MKITQEADYGMRVILYLSKLEYGAKVDAATMAKHEELPLRFLLKLLRKLIAPGIIKSFRGINGGYSLNKLPEEITLLDVIEAIDGPIYVNRCIADPGFCNAKKGNRCEIHRALSGVQKSLVLQLSKINFNDLKDGNF
ncbi:MULTISPECIES: RrF2 family transcriptional regulator [Clostridium]|jgi:Rrf2 family protein|uniref:Transcriptional regulator, BadM/Rrf2 family n=1 Tax=Clostridium saccharoperbutylacetonicum N1-4(HMT) TaxID=931276 RepID=M1MGG9_9CLOT|nr:MULTISPECIES: Rrf2 family transcriptional regulator [Clostridium]AGF55448.1 transcriptional regulator, BadM/Rrf2 family [Clostridium saccharoperbutylacetonicum N1-4(HMT)]AQR94352.1 HTH-type transcriptional regulator CymR [Clostridium saccharoperbutylacetonicum]NRT63837.1 Rrf2 family protein [Clostridium saccharoperbutylacetonicum]NSB27200.1 Rrf2 family protein [Clostridium saccharoperbutylacetonicum]NSB30052.1 Rrf2 family protein [Clostridium saccharoperbutylacetonicum]